MISFDVLNSILGEKAYNDVLWEYDENLIQIVKISEEEKISYNLKFSNLKEKYDVMIFLNEDETDFVGYCNCDKGKLGKKCEHLIWSLIRINKDLEDKSKNALLQKTDKFKIDILRDIASFSLKENEIFLRLVVIKFNDENVSFEIRGSVNKSKSYKIKNIEKFLENVKGNKKLLYGKEFDVLNYGFNKRQEAVLHVLDYINLKLKSEGKSINALEMDYELFLLFIKTFVNEQILIGDEEYFVLEALNDVNLFLKDNGGNLSLEFTKMHDYDILNGNIVINKDNRSLHILEEKDFKKLELLNNIVSNSKGLGSYRLDIDKKDEFEFKTEILPKIFNDFDISIDKTLKLEVVSEKLNISLDCFKEGKDIFIRPKFMYGEYDAFSGDINVLIRRNKVTEQSVLSFLINRGYEFDPYAKSFVISNKKVQYMFLTEDLFLLKENYDVRLDEKLRNSILNFDSSSINVKVMKNKKFDFFEVNFDIPNIMNDEIEDILKSFDEKRAFYKLSDDTFLKLSDKKIYEQLMFVRDVIKDNTYKLNNYRIPEYRALQMEVEIKNKFNKYNINQSFLNYVESIKTIPSLDDNVFHKYSYMLRNYQKEGVEWICNLYDANLGAMLADEMGLGKTLQTISFLQVKCIMSVLVVVPKALIYNWAQEIYKFAPEYEVLIVDGNQNQRENRIQDIKGKEIAITSYSSLISDYNLYENVNFDTVIIDEAQYIKNPSTKTARCVKMLKGKFFIALTGTPIQNNLLEMWSIFDFIIPGYFADLKSFKKKYKIEEDISNLKILKESASPFILRRLKKDVLRELPDKIETNLICNMEENQKLLYAEYSKKMEKEIKTYLKDEIYGKKSMQILSAITRLRQLAITPKLINENYNYDSGKVEMFLEIVSEIVSNKEKVLVFSQYTSLLSILKEKLEDKGVGYYYLDGNTKPKDRLKDVEKFNKGNISVYFISLKAGGVGLNLTSATNVIIMDPWWNPAVENQAIDRSHRIGQKDKVQVYRLISEGTIEEKILKIKKSKEKVIDHVLENEMINITNMSTEDLLMLFKV